MFGRPKKLRTSVVASAQRFKGLEVGIYSDLDPYVYSGPEMSLKDFQRYAKC
jgi:hypothetical protein